MNNYNRSNDRSRGRRDSHGRGRGGRDSNRTTMHDAVCDECGKDCKVPFRPTGDKPIYCSDCFEKRGGKDNSRSGRRDSAGKSISELTEKITVLNSKLDNIIELLTEKNSKKETPELKAKKARKTSKKKTK